MSGLLQHLSRDFDARMKLRRRMLSHLAIEVSEAQAVELREELRETLTACAGCPNPAVCQAWLDSGRGGMPAFCLAQCAFLRLEAATKLASETPEPLALAS